MPFTYGGLVMASSTERGDQPPLRASRSVTSAGGPQCERSAERPSRSAAISCAAAPNRSNGVARRYPLPIAQTRGPMEAARGDQDAAERESERVGKRSPFRRQRVPKTRKVPEGLGGELTTGLSEERERPRAPPLRPLQDAVGPTDERAGVEFEVRLDAGGEDGRGEEFGDDGTDPGPTPLDEGRAAAGERVEHGGSATEVGGREDPGNELRGISLNVGPPAVDRDRLVRPERDRSRVASQRQAILPLESLDEGRRVDEVVAFREAFEVPENEEPPSHPQDVAPATERVQDLGDTVRSVVQARGDLANGGAYRAGLAQHVAHGPGEVAPIRGRHGFGRPWQGNNGTMQDHAVLGRGRPFSAGILAADSSVFRISRRRRRRSSRSASAHAVLRTSSSRPTRTRSRSWRSPRSF